MARAGSALLAASLVALLPRPAAAAPAAGDPAPALVLPALDGTRFDLGALRGKVVLVNFWATWCPPCREEMPALDALYLRLRARGLELVGVSVDKRRDRPSVEKAAARVHYPVALLADAASEGFGKPAVLPVTYVVDREGVVRAVLKPGAATANGAELEDTVTRLLSSVGRPTDADGGGPAR